MITCDNSIVSLLCFSFLLKLLAYKEEAWHEWLVMFGWGWSRVGEHRNGAGGDRRAQGKGKAWAGQEQGRSGPRPRPTQGRSASAVFLTAPLLVNGAAFLILLWVVPFPRFLLWESALFSFGWHCSFPFLEAAFLFLLLLGAGRCSGASALDLSLRFGSFSIVNTCFVAFYRVIFLLVFAFPFFYLFIFPPFHLVFHFSFCFDVISILHFNSLFTLSLLLLIFSFFISFFRFISFFWKRRRELEARATHLPEKSRSRLGVNASRVIPPLTIANVNPIYFRNDWKWHKWNEYTKKHSSFSIIFVFDQFKNG